MQIGLVGVQEAEGFDKFSDTRTYNQHNLNLVIDETGLMRDFLTYTYRGTVFVGKNLEVNFQSYFLCFIIGGLQSLQIQ